MKRITIIVMLNSDIKGPLISDKGNNIIRKYIILSIKLFIFEKKRIFFILFLYI